jgi:hypothetical protein
MWRSLKSATFLSGLGSRRQGILRRQYIDRDSLGGFLLAQGQYTDNDWDEDKDNRPAQPADPVTNGERL